MFFAYTRGSYRYSYGCNNLHGVKKNSLRCVNFFLLFIRLFESDILKVCSKADVL